MKSMYVYHVDNEIVHDVMDGVLYSVPPGEPFEFTNPFFGKRFMEHKWFHGVVEVELERTRSGWIFKLENAHERAVVALKAADEAYNQSYIETQHQDRLLRGLPAMPPSVRQKKILQREGVNLEEYGIKPIGAKTSQERMFEQMIEQNKLMMGLIAALVQGQKIQPAQLVGVGQPVHEPEHQDPSGERVLVPPKPRNIPAPEVVDHPDPVRPAVRLYSEGEDLIPGDPSELGPEFAGDVDDPNQVPGPDMPVADKVYDLANSPIADALNLEESRVKIKVPIVAGKVSTKVKAKI